MKRTLSFMLVLCLLISLFTACSASGGTRSSKKQRRSTINTTQSETEPEELPTTAIQIDPFKGIAYEVGGISPYCTIAINTQKCSEEAQNHVTYTLDKEQYCNGDTAVIIGHKP